MNRMKERRRRIDDYLRTAFWRAILRWFEYENIDVVNRDIDVCDSSRFVQDIVFLFCFDSMIVNLDSKDKHKCT